MTSANCDLGSLLGGAVICHIRVGYHLELRVIIFFLLKRISFLIKQVSFNPLMCIIAIYVIWVQMILSVKRYNCKW